MNERDRVDSLSEWYLKEQLDFDKRLIRFRYETLKPHLQGPEGLELGPAEGEMTQFLINDFSRLTIVEGANELLAKIPERPNLVKVYSLFEEFKPDQLFNTIIMDHILEHIDHPIALMKRVKSWLVPDGKMLIGVPNGESIHRLVGVKLGFLEYPCQLNSRDLALGHRRVYTIETLLEDIRSAELEVVEVGGIFFKPVSNQQIQDHWTEEMIQGFYELGKEFPRYASDLYAVCVAA